MFERYTEKARRVIFFARYEASQFGSPYIETEHLLLGLLREDKALTNRFLRSHASVESIRKQIEGRTTIRAPASRGLEPSTRASVTSAAEPSASIASMRRRKARMARPQPAPFSDAIALRIDSGVHGGSSFGCPLGLVACTASRIAE